MSPMDPARYLDLFVSESRDHLSAAAELAERLGGEPSGGASLREMFRHLHSLKGMAATMGYAAMKDVVHAAESLLEAVRDGRVTADAERRGLLADAAACLERMVERAARGARVDDEGASALLSALRTAALAELDPSAVLEPAPAPRPRAWRAAIVLERERPFPALRAAVVLGRLGTLGRVVSSEPPMALLRTGRCDGRLAVVLESDLAPRALAAAVARLEDVASFSLLPAPETETPSVRAPARWVRVRADVLDRLMEDAQEIVRAQHEGDGGRRTRELARRIRRDLVEARLVPFDDAVRRIERGARELARALGKQVRLDVEGRDVRMDRALCDRLADPLLQLVRNAVDHGIEPPAARRAAGKPACGRIVVSVARDGESIRVEVGDDGGGLDVDRLRRAAAERGLLAVSDAARMSDADALALATLPGLSTAREGSEVSGRGVGLDVVKASVEEMGGKLAIDAAAGAGTRVTLRLPLTLALIQVLLVRCGAEVFALPASSVRAAREAGAALRDGARELSSILGAPGAPPGAGRAALELAAGRRRAIVVDEVVGRREIVVRPLAPRLAAAGIYTGAALLEDGTIVPVLAPEALS